MAASRFCPFCGLPNAAEYAFCHRCGKPLPPAVAAPTGVPPAPPPSDEPAPDDGPIERPLTDAERVGLRGSRRARLGNMTRAFGTLTGVVPPFFVVMSISGAPFVAVNYTIIILVAAFLAMILGAISLNLRLPISIALRAPAVTEARGVPEKRQAPGGLVAVTFDGLDLLAKPRLANRLVEGRMNAIAFVLAGSGGPRHMDRARAAVVAVNGDATSPEDAYVLVPPDVLKALRPRKGALARRA